MRVLVAACEPLLTEVIALAFRHKGWVIDSASEGADVVRAVRTSPPDIVVLDMVMPDMAGLDALAQMRTAGWEGPVVMLTAQDAVSERIAGLAAGVDDCVSRPLSIDELALRVRSVLRRCGLIAETSGRIVVGDLILDELSHEVTRAGEVLALTITEFDVLRYLMRSARRVVSKAEILDGVWNYDHSGRENVVELYISYLRKKVDYGREPMIHTLRGAGYLLKAAT